MTRLNYIVHEAINYRSHRKHLTNDFLSCFVFQQNGYYTVNISDLVISSAPAREYSMYSNEYGKNHSQYPDNMNWLSTEIRTNMCL